MKSIRSLNVGRCLLVAAPLLGALYSQPSVPHVAPGTHVIGFIKFRCEDYPYTVICNRNHTEGGRIGCFDSACEAQAAGAYQCRTNYSACEPH